MTISFLLSSSMSSSTFSFLCRGASNGFNHISFFFQVLHEQLCLLLDKRCLLVCYYYFGHRLQNYGESFIQINAAMPSQSCHTFLEGFEFSSGFSSVLLDVEPSIFNYHAKLKTKSGLLQTKTKR